MVSWTAWPPEEEPEHQRAEKGEADSGSSTPAVDNDHDHHSGDEDTPEAT